MQSPGAAAFAEAKAGTSSKEPLSTPVGAALRKACITSGAGRECLVMSDDPAVFRARPYAASSVSSDAVRTLMRRATTVRQPTERKVPPSSGAHSRPRLKFESVARGQNHEILAPDQFLRELEREKRRADRSKAPLSMVHWHVQPDEYSPTTAIRLLNIVNGSRRETDIVGELRAGVVGVLLPGTSEDGARVFVDKIAELTRDVPASTKVFTYPDDAFDSVASGQPVPDEAAEFVDHSVAPARPIEDIVKRTIDIVFSLTMLVALAPLMIATAIAVATTSPGPVIFRQSRLGRGGVPFDFYKFRSMQVSNDDRIHREFVSSLIQGRNPDIGHQVSGQPLFKIQHDPRVTPIGRFIRTTSIDELPQLFNVLKGDMSLVGPRPPIAYEAAQYQSWHLRRVLEVRPGITGLWQVEGRSRVSFDEMVRMDLRYIKTRSLALDLKLLVRTVGVVLMREGAK
jgi:lipopolysaccharide/colanic/teichoic acid biosynthesis glycosyltransferase